MLAKLEFMNPGGSVKDRIGPAMVDAIHSYWNHDEANPWAHSHLTVPNRSWL